MKRFLLSFVLFSIFSSQANAALILDQDNSTDLNTFYNNVLNWQQEIFVGTTGTLAQIDVYLSGQNHSIDFGINLGSPWQTDTDEFNTTILTDGSFMYSIDLSSANISVNAGDTFTLKLGSLNGGLEIRGNSTLATPYAGALSYYWYGVSSMDDSYDLGFRTYISVAGTNGNNNTGGNNNTQVPVPASIVLLVTGLVGFFHSRKKKTQA